MKILHIDSSALGDASASRALTADIVAKLKAKNPEAEVVYRDLAAAPPAHLSGSVLQAVMAPDEAGLSDEQKAERALSETLIEELLAADLVVLGAPMYNFGIPTPLKAWVDRIARAGRTFRYTAEGPVGLAGGRKVIIASSRGGVYSNPPAMATLDHQESYLSTVCGFIGITDVTVVRAEGLNLSPESRETAMAKAKGEIAGLFA